MVLLVEITLIGSWIVPVGAMASLTSVITVGLWKYSYRVFHTK